MNRRNLADELAAEIRRQIVDGILEPGERLNEVHLAEALEVSRTPLREAISRVAADGLLEQRPRYGYFVRELDQREFNDLYAMRRILDPEALRLAGLPDAAVIDKLEALNKQIEASADDSARVIDLDDEWHRTLLAHCDNKILLEQIEHFIQRTRRYELAYFREHASVGVAMDEHRQIQDAILRGDLDAAVAGLRQNMSSSEGPIQRWLNARSKMKSKGQRS